MLKEILSISGKPGLYKMVSQGKNMFVVEALKDKKRIPAFAKDKIVSLGDIAIYTETDEKPLAEVFELIKTKENSQKCSVATKSDNPTLVAYMEEILPDYDKDRVYPSDVKKLIGWYNLLIENGITEFSKSEDTPKEEEKKDA